MSGAHSPRKGLTRRNFLKTTGAAFGAAAVATAAVPQLTALAEDYEAGQPENQGEQIFRGVCRPNCFGFCHLNVHVRDGKVVKTSRAEYNESCYTRICQRGLSHVHRIYDPERLQYPMRRVEGTDRGAGEWERISWDEALQEIADKIKDVQKQYGEQAMAFLTASGNQAVGITSAYSRLSALLNASSIAPCLDMGSYYGMAAVAGNYISPLMGMGMWEGNEPTDAKNAKSIVVWGANITDAQIQNWHLIKEAMQGGTKLVVIDPTFTQIASKADKWISVRPGSDTLLKYALMNIVLEKNAQNVDYLRDHTVAPFLVREDTGKFLRRSDTGIEPTATGKTNPTTGQEIMYDPCMVLVAGELKTPEEAATAAEIEGTYDFNGVKCRTAYGILKDEIVKHTPEEVSKQVDVSIDDIYELADICIDGPVFHYEGYGPQAYNNGAHTTMAGLTLCALLGNLGKPGASYGAYWTYGIVSNAAYTTPNGASTGLTIQSVDFKNVVETGKFNGKDAPIKALWPIAQWFELEEVANAGQTSCLNYNEKAIDPLYESKPDSQIITELAQKLGLGEYFTLDNSGILEEMMNTPIGKALGQTMDDMREKKQIRIVPGDAEKKPHIAYENGAFGTATGRFEFYRENPAPRAVTTKTLTPEDMETNRMAHWFPPLEAWPENELYKKYPLVLMSERPRYRVHSQWFSAPLLRELDPEPFVKINPKDADSRGIKNGDYVECYNDRGFAVAKAVLSEAIRPGTMVYPKGWQLSQHKAGGWSQLSSTEFDSFAVNNNFMDVLCEVRVWDGGDQ